MQKICSKQRKCGDYYIPDLTVPDTKKYIIGKYGRLRRQFLEEHHKSFYTALMIEGNLPEHLAEIDETCHIVLKDTVSKMAKQEGITEQLKADNQMLWVQKMRVYQNETVLIYPFSISANIKDIAISCF